jgi:hypothetical protein
MDLLARTTYGGSGNPHHTFLEAYLADHPSKTLLEQAHRENERMLA